MAEHAPSTLSTLVKRFFLDHLREQRAVSAQTIAAIACHGLLTWP